MTELPYIQMSKWSKRISEAHKKKCDNNGITDATILGLWDKRFDFFKDGQPVYSEQFINCHMQAARDPKKERRRLFDAQVVNFAGKLCPHGDEQCNCTDFASGEVHQFAVALVKAIKDGQELLPVNELDEKQIDAALDKVASATGLNVAEQMEALAVQAKSAELRGSVTIGIGKNWQVFQQLLLDVTEDCIEALGEEKFNEQLKKTKNYDMLKWFENAVGKVDDMFESCFYHKNRSYLNHFDTSNVAYKEKVLEGQVKAQAKEFQEMVLDGEYTLTPQKEVLFHWKPDSVMARAYKMGLIYKGSLHLADLYCLFAAPRQVRRDYAALYRVWRTITMSVKDSNVAKGSETKEKVSKARIDNLFRGLIGNDESEEQIVKRASKMIYKNDASGIAIGGRDVLARERGETFRGSSGMFPGAAAEEVPSIQTTYSCCEQRAVLYSRTSPFIQTMRGLKKGLDIPELGAAANEVLNLIARAASDCTNALC